VVCGLGMMMHSGQIRICRCFFSRLSAVGMICQHAAVKLGVGDGAMLRQRGLVREP